MLFSHKSKIALALGLATMFLIGIWLGLFLGALSAPGSNLQVDLGSLTMPGISDPHWRPWLQHAEVRVSAIVFYGRRRYVRILDKYLKQNLVSSGGLLEEVLWVLYTFDEEDINWLHEVLLPSEPNLYRTVGFQGLGYGQHYNDLLPDRYYLKVDDDIVYIHPGAVDAMLHAKLQNRFYIVSANVINHSILTWVHAGLGAMQAYDQTDDDFIPSKATKPESYLDTTAFAKMKYRPHEECALYNLECAATCHYNFLTSLARNETGRYDYGMWDFHAFDYIRWSINTILFKGEDLNGEEIPDDDEEFISKDLPKSKGQHCGAIGSALVAHMAYVSQRGLHLEERTRLLQHYEQLVASLLGDLLPIY